MKASVEISQTGYVPQTGVLQTFGGAALALDWANTIGVGSGSASLSDCRDLLRFISFDFGSRLYDKEEQVSTSPYTLLLDASSDVPRFLYVDDHISIDLYVSFASYNAGLEVDDSGCGLWWTLRIQKLRRSASVLLNDVAPMQPTEQTYGPQLQLPLSAAAVWRQLSFDYSTVQEQVLDVSYPRQGPFQLFDTYYKEGVFDHDFAPSATSRSLLYYDGWYDYAVGSGTFDPSGDGLVLSLVERTRSNSALALRDRTSDDFNLEPPLIASPTYSVSRTDASSFRFTQDPSPILPKTWAAITSPFNASAVVRLTP
jgi:hypothetical protein